MSEPTDPVGLLREAAEIVLDPPLQPAPSWLTATPRNVRESLAAWLEEAANGTDYLPLRQYSLKAVAVARAIREAVNRG